MTKSIDILIDFVAFFAIIDSTSQFRRRDYAIVEQWTMKMLLTPMNTITISYGQSISKSMKKKLIIMDFRSPGSRNPPDNSDDFDDGLKFLHAR